jgi:DNA invertase Pin-like site-specific DNA recombinase
MEADNLIPAAQYLRMSTDLQQYSIDNQRATIAQYANQHGFIITRTYADEGKSGLVINKRGGLTQLLTDVLKGNTGYQAILVYDVSRWGRFQDVDESAHYEFLCRSAGVPIHYCAEEFQNDGTFPSTIAKVLKRAMAAEYSRELGVKVYRGQKTLVEQGFKVGGTAGYGLRRLMVSSDKCRQQMLEFGERKGLVTDRVILVPGPKDEVDCVRAIFAMALRGLTMTDIAHRLNRQHISYLGGRQWTCAVVGRTLRHPKYAGCNVWNRHTARLRTPPRVLPREQWIVKPAAFTPLIDRGTFDRVQEVLNRRRRTKSDEELVNALRRLLRRKGKLSEKIIRGDPDTPRLATYYPRLGRLRHLYELVGYKTPPGISKRVEGKFVTWRLRAQVLSEITDLFPQNATLFRPPERERVIVKFDSICVSLIICRSYRMRKNTLGWRLFPVAHESENITLICRLNGDNNGFHSFLLFPRIERWGVLRLREGDLWWRNGRQLELSELYRLVKEISLSGSVNAVVGARKGRSR